MFALLKLSTYINIIEESVISKTCLRKYKHLVLDFLSIWLLTQDR